MRYLLILGVFALGHLLGFAPLVQAHESRPLYIEITETTADTYKLQWKIPLSIPISNAPTISLPATCQSAGLPPEQRLAPSAIGQSLYHCPGGLVGQAVTIHYPSYNPSVSSMVRYQAVTGEQHTALLGPQEMHWTVPQAETPSRVAKDYTRLGIQHIWAGVDHLLFLVCLLWIAGSLRRILVTITGFTLAHSLTLILSALHIVQVPVPPVEAVIALSVVFLATEIAKGRRHSLTWRYPIAVSSSFGLLHGLGFAAVLAEIGLPQTALLTGLLFFNVGVELGQVLFAVLAIALIKGAQRWLGEGRDERTFRLAMSYGVGVVASYWVIERSLGFL